MIEFLLNMGATFADWSRILVYVALLGFAFAAFKFIPIPYLRSFIVHVFIIAALWMVAHDLGVREGRQANKTADWQKAFELSQRRAAEREVEAKAARDIAIADMNRIKALQDQAEEMQHVIDELNAKPTKVQNEKDDCSIDDAFADSVRRLDAASRHKGKAGPSGAGVKLR